VNVPVLAALAIPIAYLVVTTVALLRHPGILPPFLQRLSSYKALAWNTMVGIPIALGALHWALHR